MRRLPSDCLLLDARLYEEYFNLNELTEKDLSDCAWMKSNRLQADALTPGRRYTFPELRALYGAHEAYVKLYNQIASEKQDYRLRVLAQFLSRSLLDERMPEHDVTVLAGRLSEKPLYDWQRCEFKHIEGIRGEDTVQLLIHLDKLRHLLPCIKSNTNVKLVLRNLDSLSRFDSVDALKENTIQVDDDWRALSERMQLSEDFQNRYRENIISFICRNGALIAQTYRDCLPLEQEDAFLRVVKAELMGEFCTLKYFEGDLQRELNFPLSAGIQKRWKANLSITEAEVSVRERDDFFATMLLGVQPQRTCLSYINGQYRKCLLSGFDSNKKVLYATVNNRVSGRALLRLTKGRLTLEGTNGESPENHFTFVDVENLEDKTRSDTHNGEQITLFLECPYISGVGPDTERRIKRLLIELAVRKADELGVMLVLSKDYSGEEPEGFARAQFNIYISKTKAGAQYLDSLDGEATVSSEGSYKSNTFLVRQRSNRV